MSFMDPSGRVAKAFIIFGIWIILFWVIPQRELFSLLYSIVFIVLLANIIFQIYKVEKEANKNKKLKKLREKFVKQINREIFLPNYVIFALTFIITALLYFFYKFTELEFALIYTIIFILLRLLYNKFLRK